MLLGLKILLSVCGTDEQNQSGQAIRHIVTLLEVQTEISCYSKQKTLWVQSKCIQFWNSSNLHKETMLAFSSNLGGSKSFL